MRRWWRCAKVIPQATDAQVDEAMQRGFAEALSHGVTQIHDMSEFDWTSLEAFRRARANGKLPIRVYSFVPLADWSKMADFVRHTAAAMTGCAGVA